MRVYLETHGCAVTQGESRIIESMLGRDGHTRTSTPDDSDANILVTCAVVERTERDMVRRITALKETGKRLVVTGCLASSRPDLVKGIAPEATLLPPDKVGHAAAVLETGTVPESSAPRVGVPRPGGATVETVVINDGCTGSCSFCITKIARPGLDSFDERAVVEDVRRAVESGAVEIRLTSMDTAAYGAGTGRRLPDLLKAVTDLDGDFRVRVGMMNPFAALPLLDDLLNAYASPKIFKFLHIPVQSGSERILASMGRHHSPEDILYIVDGFRRRFPEMNVATDVITGFPGETDADFEATLRLSEAARPDTINITRFSARPGTRAALLKDQVPSRIATDRSRVLTQLRVRISRERLGAFVGRRQRAIATECVRPGTTMLRTDEYRPVIVAEAPLGRWYDVEIGGATDFWMTGSILGGATSPGSAGIAYAENVGFGKK